MEDNDDYVICGSNADAGKKNKRVVMENNFGMRKGAAAPFFTSLVLLPGQLVNAFHIGDQVFGIGFGILIKLFCPDIVSAVDSGDYFRTVFMEALMFGAKR